jgi:hypothetical protein
VQRRQNRRFDVFAIERRLGKTSLHAVDTDGRWKSRHQKQIGGMAFDQDAQPAIERADIRPGYWAPGV